jgi:hypothetical protein
MDRTPRSSRSSGSPNNRRHKQDMRSNRTEYNVPQYSHRESASPVAELTTGHGLGLSNCDLPASYTVSQIPISSVSPPPIHPTNYWAGGGGSDNYYPSLYPNPWTAPSSTLSYETPMLPTSDSTATYSEMQMPIYNDFPVSTTSVHPTPSYTSHDFSGGSTGFVSAGSFNSAPQFLYRGLELSSSTGMRATSRLC